MCTIDPCSSCRCSPCSSRRSSGAPVDALQAPAGTKAIVFLFTSTDCPISNRYAPEVRRIAEAFGAKGVVFRLVYPNPSEDAKAIREHMAAYALRGRRSKRCAIRSSRW